MQHKSRRCRLLRPTLLFLLAFMVANVHRAQAAWVLDHYETPDGVTMSGTPPSPRYWKDYLHLDGPGGFGDGTNYMWAPSGTTTQASASGTIVSCFRYEQDDGDGSYPADQASLPKLRALIKTETYAFAMRGDVAEVDDGFGDEVQPYPGMGGWVRSCGRHVVECDPAQAKLDEDGYWTLKTRSIKIQASCTSSGDFDYVVGIGFTWSATPVQFSLYCSVENDEWNSAKPKLPELKTLDAFARRRFKSDGVPEHPVQWYWAGAADYELFASAAGEYNVFDPDVFQWTATGAPLVVPDNPDNEHDLGADWNRKSLTFDLGPTLGTSIPKTTVTGSVTGVSANSEVMTGNVKVNWHQPYVFAYIGWHDEAQPDAGIDELISRIQRLHSEQIAVGANLVELALHGLYIAPAEQLLIAGAIHTVASVAETAYEAFRVTSRVAEASDPLIPVFRGTNRLDELDVFQATKDGA